MKCLRAALVASALTSLVDLLGTWFVAEERIGAGAWTSALVAALGFYGVLALGIGIASEIVSSAMNATFDVRNTLGELHHRVRNDAKWDRQSAAAVVASVGALLVVLIVTGAYALLFGFEMARKRNGALTTGVVAALSLFAAAIAFFPLFRVTRHAVVVLPRPRVYFTLGLLTLAVGVTSVFALSSVDWRVLDFGPAEALLFYCVAGLLVWRLWQNAHPLVLPGLALFVIACLLFSWSRFGGDKRALAFLAEETRGAKALYRIAVRVTDRDKDGYAARFGGGDCDDSNPNLYPGASEIAGNGVDEDCDGEDAPAPRADVAPKPIEASDLAKRFRWNGNWLFITIDTLRADRLNDRIMPKTSAFAKTAVRFSNVYAQAPNTPRSFPSFLTSRLPSAVKWERLSATWPKMLPIDDNTTFFQVFKRAGYYVVGEFSHIYLDPKYNVHRGFDEWHDDGALSLHDSNTDSAAPRITARAEKRLAALKARAEKWVLWTHLFEPHSRYMEHAEFPVKAKGIEGLEEKYDGEVSYVDLHVGKLLDALDRLDLAKDTAVVIFADHGEGFGEHRFGGQRMYFHGETIYDEILRVPMIVRVPGISPRVVDGTVMLTDLGPTVVDIAKAERPASFWGRSLLAAMLGEPLPDAPAYAELLPTPSWNHRWRAIITNGEKLIEKLSENTVEFYDLKSDPNEKANLSGTKAARVDELRKRLRRDFSSL